MNLADEKPDRGRPATVVVKVSAGAPCGIKRGYTLTLENARTDPAEILEEFQRHHPNSRVTVKVV